MRIQIELDADQTPDEAEEVLYKALSAKRDGSAHETETFLDPAMQDQAEKMKQVYTTSLGTMLAEIQQVLDEG